MASTPATPNIAALFASIKATQGGRTTPVGISTANQSSLDKALASVKGTPAVKAPTTAWDSFWHGGSQLLNDLGSIGYGIEKATDATYKNAIQQEAQAKLGQQSEAQAKTNSALGVLNPVTNIGNFFAGMGNAIGNNAKGNPTGSQILQDDIDLGTGHVLPSEGHAPINPWVKGLGGFGIDVASDPLTYVPGGAIESVVKGSIKAGIEGARDVGEGLNAAGKSAGTLRGLAAATSPKTALASLGEWSAKTAAEKVNKTAFKASVAAYKAGTAGAEDAATLARLVPRARTLTSKIISPIAAAQDASKIAKVAKLAGDNPELEQALQRTRPLTASENADRVAKAAEEATKPTGGLDPTSVAKLGPATAKIVEQTPKAIDSIPEVADSLSSIKTRQDAALNPPAQAVSDSLPITHADALDALRKVSYSKATVPAKARAVIEKLGPIPVADRSPSLMRQDPKALTALNNARSKWLTTVNQTLGEDAKKTLQRIKDPTEFAAKAAELTSASATKDYAGAKLSDILRGINTKSRMHDEGALQNAANTLGYTKRNFGKMSMTDFFRKRSLDVTDRLDKLKLQEKANQSLFNHLEIPDGDLMESLAKGTDPAAAVGAAATDFAHLADDATPEENARFLASWKSVGGDAYGIGDAALYKGKDGLTIRNLLTKTTGEKYISSAKVPENGARTILKNVWEQNKTYSFIKQSLTRLSEEAKLRGLGDGANREDFMYNGFLHDMTMLDSRLRSFGISPVTGTLSKEAALTKIGNADQWAFLGMSDVLKALPEDVVKGLLLAGKDISTAPTLIYDTARYALKAGPEGVGSLTQGEKASVIMTTLLKRVNDFSDGHLKKYMLSESGLRNLRAMVGTMLSNPVEQKLIEANVRNGAFARVVVGEQAHVASNPAIKVLMQGFGKADGTIGNDIDAVQKSLNELRKAIPRTGLSGTDAATVAGWDLEHVIASIGDVGTQKNIRNAFRMDSATKINETGNPLAEAVVDAQKAKTAAKIGRGANGKLKVPGATILTDARKAVTAEAAAGAAEARAGEVKVLAPEIEELTQRLMESAADEGTTADLNLVRAQLTMGLPGWLKTMYRLGEKMSGSFGMSSLKSTEVGYAMSERVRSLDFTHDLNQLEKAFGKDALEAAGNALRTMPDNDLSHLSDLSPQIQQAAAKLWPLMNRVFDHSDHSFLDRVGWSANYINQFLRRNGIDPAYHMVDGTEAWENSQLWKKWEFNPDGQSMIDVLDAYHRALQQASVVPGIAGSFSAEFGHRSDTLGRAMTDAEARANPEMVKINPVKGQSQIAEFVDPTQWYPKEAVGQLAMMDKYLASSKYLDKNGGLFDQVFRRVDPIIRIMKGSITLDRPGHWFTNIAGEAGFNTLAGVINPARYLDSIRILKSRGLFEGKSDDQILDYLKRTAPENQQLKLADSGVGQFATFGGKTVQLSYDSVYRMLDDYGVILHHNNAEDLVGGEGLDSRIQTGVGKVLQKVQHLTQPDWLANRSADRDTIFRIAQASDMLAKHNYRNVDDAMRQIAKAVHSYHPTVGTLSAFEQKYARRLVYFYTWQRQALSRVIESMIDTPGRVMVAPKALYNITQANGLTPQSWGLPEPDNQGIPQYSTGLMTDYFWNGGETLGPQASNPYAASASFIWGASISSPQLDILQSVFGNTQIDPRIPNGGGIGPGLLTGLEQTAGGLETPLLAIPEQLISNTQFSTGGVNSNPTAIPDQGAFLLNQTGLGYVAKAIDPTFGLAKTKTPLPPAEQQANQQRDILNWLTGLKAQDLTTPKKQIAANLTRNAENAKVIAAGGKVK